MAIDENWLEVGHYLSDDIPRILDQLKAEYPEYRGSVLVSPPDRDGFYKLELQMSSPERGQKAYKPIPIDPQDAALLSTRNYTIKDYIDANSSHRNPAPQTNMQGIPTVGSRADLVRCLSNITRLYVELVGHETAYSREARAALAVKEQSPAPQTNSIGDDGPRYSMKRMRDEIAKAKAEARRDAIEEAAKAAEEFRAKDWIAHDSKIGIFPKKSEAGVAIADRIRALANPEAQDHA